MLSFISVLGFFIIGVVVWLVTALAIFFAARVIAGSKATYAKALGVTLLGVIIISVSAIMLTAFLGSILGSILIFVIWLALIKSVFQTGWLGAVGISILAVFMLIVIMVILSFLFTLIGLPFIQPPIPMPTQRF